MRFLSLFSDWVTNLRWRELTAIVAAAYAGGLQLAQYVHADTAKQQEVGVVLAALAAICYVLNPKYTAWVDAIPHVSPQAAQAIEAVTAKIGFLNVSAGYDPYANTSDEEANKA